MARSAMWRVKAGAASGVSVPSATSPPPAMTRAGVSSERAMASRWAGAEGERPWFLS